MARRRRKLTPRQRRFLFATVFKDRRNRRRDFAVKGLAGIAALVIGLKLARPLHRVLLAKQLQKQRVIGRINTRIAKADRAITAELKKNPPTLKSASGKASRLLNRMRRKENLIKRKARLTQAGFFGKSPTRRLRAKIFSKLKGAFPEP